MVIKYPTTWSVIMPRHPHPPRRKRMLPRRDRTTDLPSRYQAQPDGSEQPIRLCFSAPPSLPTSPPIDCANSAKTVIVRAAVIWRRKRLLVLGSQRRPHSGISFSLVSQAFLSHQFPMVYYLNYFDQSPAMSCLYALEQ